MRPQWALAIAGVVLCGVLVVFIKQRNSGPQAPAKSLPGAIQRNESASPTSRAPFVPTRPPEAKLISVESVASTKPASGSTAQKPSRPDPQNKTTKAGKDPIKDPLAREALAWVGYSEEAEAYWADAINDPDLSAQERQDLIEDLNEDGISDPKQPAFEDLPLILARLEIIESLAPKAMDQVNADAFKEAYKDLVNLAFVAAGARGGQ